MQDFQQEFIEFSISKNVLKFGEFKLKSGRISPYFFNSGLFNDGESLRLLGEYYAKTIINSAINFDMLFGPAYKGIPLATSLAIALSQTNKRSVQYCFNRKEAKDHGEGGIILGAPLSNDVLIVDDVITAGTSVKESVKIIEEANARPVGVIIALDRQEKGNSKKSAIQEIEINYNIPVISIISLELLIEYLSNTAELSAYLGKIEEYQINYGIKCR
ncbi:MAG: orotate phosphoribosyltransferase [Gammaproteobacteria bacterium]|jgi:orotate phosphoribosyltransferase